MRRLGSKGSCYSTLAVKAVKVAAVETVAMVDEVAAVEDWAAAG